MEDTRRLVATDEWLFRRSFLPERKYMAPDGSATSRVFKLREKDNGELSVDVKSLTTPEKAIGDPTKFLLFQIHNKYVEEIGLKTYHDEVPDGTNNAHAAIIGMTIEDDILPGLLAKKSKRLSL